MSSARALLALVAGGLALAACAPDREAPVIQRVVPGELLQSTGGAARIEGAAFFADLRDPFWSATGATVDRGFTIFVGGRQLEASALTGSATDRLEVVIPAGLPLGEHEVRIRTPGGREAVRVAALAIVDSSTPVVSVEDTAEGLGAPIGARSLVAGSAPLVAHAVLRSQESGRYLGMAPSSWTLSADLGELNADSSGASASFTARTEGTTRITATPLGIGAPGSTGELVVTLPALSLGFASAAQTLPAGTCSAPIQLRLQDASGAPFPAPGDAALTLSASGAPVTFSLQPDCATATSAATLPGGQSMVSVYARATVPGSYTLTVDHATFAPGQQPLTITPGGLNTFAWNAISPVRSGVAFPVTVRAQDAYGNVDGSFTGTAALSLGGGGTLACVSGCTGTAETGAFVGGSWSGTVSVTATTPGARTLQAVRGAASGSSSPFTLVALRSPPSVRVNGAPVIVASGGSVSVDASASSDYQSPASALQYSFDFASSTSPPPWSPWSSNPTTTQVFSAEGYYTARVAVRDADGDIGYGTLLVLVLRPQDKFCVVDDPSATLDDGATSCSAKGSGGKISLAEAFRIATGSGNGNKGIIIGPGVRVSGPASFTISGNWWIMSNPGAGSVLDGVHFTVPADQQLILAGLELTAPGATLMTVQPGGFAALENTYAHDFTRILAEGALWTFRAELSRCSSACIRMSTSTSFAYSRYTAFTDSAVGIGADVCPSADGMNVAATVFLRNQVGVQIGAGCPSAAIVNATFDGNVVGARLDAGITSVQNSIFSSNGTAVQCPAPATLLEDASLLFANTSEGCAGSGSAVLRADPLYLQPSGDDFRLDLASPATNSGVAVPSVDLNDVAPSAFTGSAPDRGGRETW